jgi:hypothetical protein
MDDKARIAHLFRPYGEVVGPDDFDDVVATGLQGQLEIYRTLASDIDCVFLADMTFNAVATSDGSRYAIGINIGAAVLTARYAYCLMSDPTIFPEIGDPSCETVDPYVIESLRRPIDWTSYGRYLPRNPVRLGAAKQLSLAACLMLFFHEINHVELGHLDFVRDQLGATEYREIRAAPVDIEDSAILRALEWEADLAALHRSLQVWRVLYPLFDVPALAALTPEASWFLAVELLFWIMDFVEPDKHVGLLATHPSPMARLVNARELTTVASWVSTQDDAGPLVPWISRNGFSSAALKDPLYRDPNRILDEVGETSQRLAELIHVLDSYRRLPSERR